MHCTFFFDHIINQNTMAAVIFVDFIRRTFLHLRYCHSPFLGFLAKNSKKEPTQAKSLVSISYIYIYICFKIYTYQSNYNKISIKLIHFQLFFKTIPKSDLFDQNFVQQAKLPYKDFKGINCNSLNLVRHIFFSSTYVLFFQSHKFLRRHAKNNNMIMFFRFL